MGAPRTARAGPLARLWRGGLPHKRHRSWRMRGLRRAEVQPVAPQVIGIIASHHAGHLLPCRRAGALSTATCWQLPLMGFAHIGERCRRKRIFEKPARSDQEERREGDRFFTRPGIEIFEELYGRTPLLCIRRTTLIRSFSFLERVDSPGYYPLSDTLGQGEERTNQ